MKVFIVDNYDSFTFNLVHIIEALGAETIVRKNDAFTMDEVESCDKIILSPGPGLPKEVELMTELIKRYHTTKPILGVCLGMQAIAEFFGENLINLNVVKHGISETVFIKEKSELFKNIPSSFKAGLYHSWAVAPFHNNPKLKISAISESDIVMAIEHTSLPLYGVQFHPESIMTKEGRRLMENFLQL